MRDHESEKREKLLDDELELLAGEVMELKRAHRADLDELKLEFETLKLFMARVHPGFDEQYKALKEQVRLEISPE
ncbi:MAG: hypothetical protein L0229_17965 [Blastocatellia bacterium]|nr:hypothetical protein [Blastocatellia bacterium]